MNSNQFNNFLRVLEFYKLKQIPRNSSNNYHDEKDNVIYKRKETTAEHIYSCLKLADYFIVTEEEFSNLDKLKVYELLLYHDDLEIVTRDIGISERDKRLNKKDLEINAMPILLRRLPQGLDKKLLECNEEYESQISEESRFARGIDKFDALVHEFQYPSDWGPKGFDERNVRNWFQGAFDYSPTFTKYFERTIKYLENNGFFKS